MTLTDVPLLYKAYALAALRGTFLILMIGFCTQAYGQDRWKDLWNSDVGMVFALGQSGSTLLVGAANGLYIGDTATTKTNRIPIDMGPIRCFLTLNDRVLIGSDVGLFDWKLPLQGIPTQLTGEVTGRVIDLKYLNGILWIGAEKGLFKWAFPIKASSMPTLVWASTATASHPLDSRVYQILPLNDVFLIASNAGLVAWWSRTPTNRPVMLTKGMGPVVSVEYQEPMLWISTHEHGLFVRRVGRFRTNGEPVELRRLGMGYVSHLEADGKTLWLGTNTGLWRWENATGLGSDTGLWDWDKPSHGDLRGIAATAGGAAHVRLSVNGALYVGGAKGLLRLPLPTEEIPWTHPGVIDMFVDDSGISPDDDNPFRWSAKANQLCLQAKCSEALPYIRKALELRKASGATETIESAQDLHLLGIILSLNNDLREAQVNFDKALHVLTKLNAKRSALGAALLRDEGYVLDVSGNKEGAAKQYAVAREIGDLPEADAIPDLGRALMSKGDLLFNNSDYVGARVELENSLRATAPSHPDHSKFTAEVKFDLGQLFAAVGDFASAVKMFSDASAEFEALSGNYDYARGRILTQLGTLLCRQGEYARSIDLLTRAKHLLDQPLPDYESNERLRLLDVSTTTYVLAQAEAAVHDNSQALPDFELVLDYYGRLFGQDSLQVADVLVQTLMLPQRDHNKDLTVLQRVENSLQHDHSADGLPVLQGLATYYMSQNKLDLTLRTETLASSAFDDIIKTNLTGMSLAQQQLFLTDKVTGQIGVIVSSMLRGAPAAEGYNLLVTWKGLLLDSVSWRRAISGETSKVTKAEVGMIGGEPHHDGVSRDSRKPKEEQQQVANLSESERELTGRSKNLSQHLNLTYKEVQEALGVHEVFVDFYRYQDNPERVGLIHWAYAAVVSGRDFPPRTIRLGDAADIDGAISAWFEAASQGNTSTHWEHLVDLLWTPVERSLPQGTLTIWASPDGELARVPLQLLCRSTQSLAQVDSPEELIAMSKLHDVTPSVGERLLLVGAVDYDAKRAGEVLLPATVHFARLDKTLEEIRAIKILSDSKDLQTVVLKSDTATKSNVIRFIVDSTYVHFATHGYFFGPDSTWILAGSFSIRATEQFDMTVQSQYTNLMPFSSSGIALTGANLPSADDTGTLSAQEFVGLDLSKTRLVVMSACETGRGDLAAGSQGILGFRTALLGAGAHSVVLSLWKVPDEATKELMALFYANLWGKNMNVYDSLAAAQRTLKQNPQYSAERYWAAWVIVGRAW